MNPELRKSIFTKSAALAFSLILLLGNLWLAFSFLGGDAPSWLNKLMLISVIWVAVSGIGMAGFRLYLWYRDHYEKS